MHRPLRLYESFFRLTCAICIHISEELRSALLERIPYTFGSSLSYQGMCYTFETEVSVRQKFITLRKINSTDTLFLCITRKPGYVKLKGILNESVEIFSACVRDINVIIIYVIIVINDTLRNYSAETCRAAAVVHSLASAR